MSKNIVALQTARAGSKSIPKKNLLEVDGHPLFAHSTRAAVGCELINSVWCSTDDSVIKSYHDFYDFTVIDRPPELSGDTDSHL
jgi:CMP-N,N'-diacetyllegionaminic acid synthase